MHTSTPEFKLFLWDMSMYLCRLNQTNIGLTSQKCFYFKKKTNHHLRGTCREEVRVWMLGSWPIRVAICGQSHRARTPCGMHLGWWKGGRENQWWFLEQKRVSNLSLVLLQEPPNPCWRVLQCNVTKSCYDNKEFFFFSLLFCELQWWGD